MKVYRKINDIEKTDKPVVLAMGTFDGLHLGHNALLDTVLKFCEENKGEPYVFTFSNSPKAVFQPYVKHMQLLSWGNKLWLLEKKGFTGVILIDFSTDFAKINAEVLCNLLQSKFINLKIVVGYDFRMGKGTVMDAEALVELGKKSGFDVHIVPMLKLNDDKISSTIIRSLIREGNVLKVKSLLGRVYSIEGIVETGNQKGRKIGFPTVNIKNEIMVYPRDGVYFTALRISHEMNEYNYSVFDDKLYYGMTFVGKNTLSRIDTPAIEMNVFNFDTDVYGKWVKIFFLERIRDTLKFNNFEELKAQLIKDKEICIKEIKKTEEKDVY